MIVSLVCALICLALLFIDLFSKALAEAYRVFQDGYFLGFVRLNFVKNEGMAFGIFDDNPAAMAVVTVLTVAMIVGIAVLFFTLFKKNVPVRVALAVIEAGALGNLIDRVVLGYVRDFVDVSPIGFGVCNLADFFITFGAVALFLIVLFVGEDAVIPLGRRRKEKKAEEEPPSDGHE